MSGPGARREKCFSVGLVDLGDVEGFDSAPQENEIYGLKFNSGFYRRSVVPTSPGREETNFEELVNTEDAKIHVHYCLVKNAEGIWSLIDTPNWIIDIQIIPMSLMSGKSNRLKKIMNRGSALISYVPSKNKSVLISEFDDSYYLTRNDEVESAIPVFLSMISDFPDQKFKVSKEFSTTIIDLFLLNPPEDFVQILPGFSIKWASEAAQKRCCLVLKNGEPWFSLPGIQFDTSHIITLKKIVFNDNIHFRKLLYVDRIVSENYLISIKS